MKQPNECKCCQESFAATSTQEEYCPECEAIHQEVLLKKQAAVILSYMEWCQITPAFIKGDVYHC